MPSKRSRHRYRLPRAEAYARERSDRSPVSAPYWLAFTMMVMMIPTTHSPSAIPPMICAAVAFP